MAYALALETVSRYGTGVTRGIGVGVGVGGAAVGVGTGMKYVPTGTNGPIVGSAVGDARVGDARATAGSIVA
jgi:hypothetical protein